VSELRNPSGATVIKRYTGIVKKCHAAVEKFGKNLERQGPLLHFAGIALPHIHLKCKNLGQTRGVRVTRYSRL